MEKVDVGIIGGSGLYEIKGWKAESSASIETPFGKPSGEYIIGELEGKRVAFLPRHGKGHRISPSEINFLANIYGFKKLGVEQIISVSAVGSMNEEIAPGDVVIIDQFFDRTKLRPVTFFKDGIVGHIGFSDPICPVLSNILYESGKKKGYRTHKGGTYICIEGPQFSTRAESRVYRQWGVDVIGMTNIPEAKLAREAEICYSTICMVTDYDCWHETEETVSVEGVIKILMENVEKAKEIIRTSIPMIESQRRCECSRALECAVITSPKHISLEARKRLELLLGKYWQKTDNRRQITEDR